MNYLEMFLQVGEGECNDGGTIPTAHGPARKDEIQITVWRRMIDMYRARLKGGG